MATLSAVFAADDNVLAVVTIRSDSYATLQGEPRLAELRRLPFDLPRLSTGAFKEIIEGPGRLSSPQIRGRARLDRSTYRGS